MMNLNLSREWKNAIAIVGITIALYFVLMPRKKGYGKPDKATNDEVSQKQNARTILDAYLNAVDANEPASELTKLNALFAEEYSMKVYRTKSGGYVARTLSGKDVLIAK